jgi:hypothetical protein
MFRNKLKIPKGQTEAVKSQDRLYIQPDYRTGDVPMLETIFVHAFNCV